MSAINDGGQAFPIPDVSKNQTTDEVVVHQSSPGLTVRDYFAAKAMQVLLQDVLNTGLKEGLLHIAPSAYEFADDMLKERGKP